jgi:dihydrofolate synthase/folylpolyglutamate synthase
MRKTALPPERRNRHVQMTDLTDNSDHKLLVDPEYKHALLYLERLTNLGIKPGLERMQFMVNSIGDPQRAAPVIHITGTNGKTSTARMISALLAAHGLRPGTYTSPHLQVVNERIAVDLAPISKRAFASAFRDAYVAARELERQLGENPSYFEMVTLMAFAAFADAPVDVQVLEVGMGGRWDATNVADADVAVVTNVGLDHMEYLGSSPPLIAAEKAGILKEGSDLVCGETDPEVVEVFSDVASRTRVSRSYLRTKDFALLARRTAVGGQLISVKGIHGTYEDVMLPLFGRFQADNATVAIAAAEAFLDRALVLDLVREAFSAVAVPGRMEVVKRQPLVLLDGAHNPAGISACIEAIRESFAYDDAHIVFGVFADKDYKAMLRQLVPFATALYATQTELARAAPATEIAGEARRLGLERVYEYESVNDALDGALGAASETDLVLVTGSLYVVGEARTHLCGEPSL